MIAKITGCFSWAGLLIKWLQWKEESEQEQDRCRMDNEGKIKTITVPKRYWIVEQLEEKAEFWELFSLFCLGFCSGLNFVYAIQTSEHTKVTRRSQWKERAWKSRAGKHTICLLRRNWIQDTLTRFIWKEREQFSQKVVKEKSKLGQGLIFLNQTTWNTEQFGSLRSKRQIKEIYLDSNILLFPRLLKFTETKQNRILEWELPGKLWHVEFAQLSF